MKLNFIECSPRGTRSHSSKIANEYMEQAKKNISDLEIRHINLWNENLPEFNGDMLNAKYSVISGENPSGEQESAWASVKGIFDTFNDADHYLFSVPMWNFNIPYKLIIKSNKFNKQINSIYYYIDNFPLPFLIQVHTICSWIAL